MFCGQKAQFCTCIKKRNEKVPCVKYQNVTEWLKVLALTTKQWTRHVWPQGYGLWLSLGPPRLSLNWTCNFKSIYKIDASECACLFFAHPLIWILLNNRSVHWTPSLAMYMAEETVYSPGCNFSNFTFLHLAWRFMNLHIIFKMLSATHESEI